MNTHQQRDGKSKGQGRQSKRVEGERGGGQASGAGGGCEEEVGSLGTGKGAEGRGEGEVQDECSGWEEQEGEGKPERECGLPSSWLDQMPLHMWELPACSGCDAKIQDSSSFIVYPCKHTVRIFS